MPLVGIPELKLNPSTIMVRHGRRKKFVMPSAIIIEVPRVPEIDIH